MAETPIDGSEIHALERPHRKLWTYYIIASLPPGPFCFLTLIPLYFRYHSMRYRFGKDGVSMRWGILFRREINLTYARIQDIHLSSNLVERWLGLARIQVQTASGSAKAEMTIEGILQYKALRDYLYSRMRGVRSADILPSGPPVSGTPGNSALDEETAAELTDTLREVALELRALRRNLAHEDDGDPPRA